MEELMAESTSQIKGKRQSGSGFNKPVQPDEKLAEVIGNEPLSRTEVTKKVWEYIRSHGLQDPENKTFIKADSKLRPVLDGKDRVSMFEMTKLVSGHLK
jgi:chromatin remodeling complex protein RSC6